MHEQKLMHRKYTVAMSYSDPDNVLGQQKKCKQGRAGKTVILDQGRFNGLLPIWGSLMTTFVFIPTLKICKEIDLPRGRKLSIAEYLGVRVGLVPLSRQLEVG
jgi:hypothetical protein